MGLTRTDLQTLLETLCDNVYFQPPSDVNMVYPAIVYNRQTIRTSFANNSRYKNKNQYMVMVIDRDPDSAIPDAVANLPFSSLDRTFAADQLNHSVFTLYF